MVEQTRPRKQPTDPVTIPQAPSYCLADLRALPVGALRAAAEEAGLQDAWRTDRRSLILALQARGAEPAELGQGDGILEVHPDGFGFLRSTTDNCEPGPDDVYVSARQIQQLRLRPGQHIHGWIRTPHEGESFFALMRVETVDTRPIAPNEIRAVFDDDSPVLPYRALSLDGPETPVCARAIDLLAPLAFGQRVLLRIPPGIRQAPVLADLATGILHNHPKAEVLALSVDQGPEQQIDLHRRLEGQERAQLFAAPLDQTAARQTALANLVLARACRLVEDGADVVLFLDSLTSLARALNITTPHSGKVISAGLDTDAVHAAKAMFCRARQAEGGASLTIIATLRVDPASPMDTAIASEFDGTASATVSLDQALADLQIDPPICVSGSTSLWQGSFLDDRAQEVRRAARRAVAADPAEVAAQRILAAIASPPVDGTLAVPDLGS